jgi:hypothetical protein
MFPFDAQRVTINARQATTEDLLNRVTVEREGMEPEALEIIEAELQRRGVTRQDMERHQHDIQRDALMDPSGIALRCSFCNGAAIEERWGWHRLWGRLPLFPRRFRYCKQHLPH